MRELINENGILCACVNIRKEDSTAWAIVVSWKRNVDGLPDARTWNEAIETCIAQCKEKGATVIDSRVITASEGVDEDLAAARATLHRDSLLAHGFAHGQDRVEYRVDLHEAIEALEEGAVTTRLAWSCVDTSIEAKLIRTADIFRQAAEGDPASHPEDDALGFLLNFLEEGEAAIVPERVQIGTCAGVPAAVLALMAYPSDGWSTIYYLGVLPAFRRRGFGAEAMLHGLRCLKSMGGKTYEDGTGLRNAAACSLFARLGRPPFRTLEEWRLKK